MNCILLSAINDNDHNKQTACITDTKQLTHITKILKLNVGDSLKVGLIQDNLGTATISHIDNERITLTDIALPTPPPQKLALTLILALPRPKVLRRLIMDMTSYGVEKIILVNSYRTEKSYWQSPMLNRIDEFVMEGLQQAVDTVPPTIELKKRLKPFVEDEFYELLTHVIHAKHAENTDNVNSIDTTGQAVIAHPYSEQSWRSYQHEHSLPHIVCIGAEGGWIDYEVALFKRHGCSVVRLGSRILRTETAVNGILGSWL